MVINKKYVFRLSLYRNALLRLKDLGLMKVFSDNLADAAGVTSSQVRKDFSIFGIKGNRRGGYNIDKVIDCICEILGKNDLQELVLFGVGNIGKALLRYKGFESSRFKILAAFDIDFEKCNEDQDVPVYPMGNAHDFIATNEIKIGILAVPEAAAHHVSEIMTKAGIKGILNFTPIQLRSVTGVVVNSINIDIELENLLYFVNST